MPTAQKPRTPIVVPALPELVLLLIAFVNALILAIKGNPKLQSPNPSPGDMQSRVDALAAAQVATKKRVPGAAQDRDDKESAVRHDVRAFVIYLQTIVNGMTVEEALTLIVAMGFRARLAVKQAKALLTAQIGPYPLSALLRAKSAGLRTIYYWQFSVDAVNWTSAVETPKATTIITGLPAGQMVHFRFAWRKDGILSSWSPSVSLQIK
jgi:hypothetical protein